MLKTYTGRTFDYQNITKDSIYIPDVLRAISSLNRFLGHSSRPYSVGEHTLLGLIVAKEKGYTPLQQLHWLIHDFTEGYVGDCPTPLKKLLPEFSIYEAKVETAILEHLELDTPTDEEYELIKRIDETMLVIEMRDLTTHNHENYITELTYKELLERYSITNLNDLNYLHEDIREALMECFNDLMKEVKGEDFKCLEI